MQIDYTLAVDPTGLPGDQINLLQDAKNKGVKVSVVNLMTMDYYDGQPVINDALSSARAAASQLAGLYGISTSAAYGKEGLTPIAGRNDDGAQFSQGDAQTLESFAAGNGVAELSFWEVDSYDKGTGYAYSRIFNEITGTAAATPPAADRDRPDHRLPGPVPGRPLGLHRQLQPDPGLHLQRHQRAEWTVAPATPCRRWASAWTSTRPAPPTAPWSTSTTATAPARRRGSRSPTASC